MILLWKSISAPVAPIAAFAKSQRKLFKNMYKAICVSRKMSPPLEINVTSVNNVRQNTKTSIVKTYASA